MTMRDAETRQLRLLSWTLHAVGMLPTAGIILLVWFAYVVPTGTAKQALRAEIDRTARQLSTGSVIRAEHRQLEQQLAANRDKIALVRRRMPDQAGEDEFLRLIADAAEKSELTIQEYSRGKENRRPDFSALDVHIRAHGSFTNVCRFLDYLQRIPRISKIVSLQLGGRAAGDYPLEMTVRLFYGVRVSAGPTGKGA